MADSNNQNWDELDEKLRQEIEEAARKEIEELLKNQEFLKEIEKDLQSELQIDSLGIDLHDTLLHTLEEEKKEIVQDSIHTIVSQGEEEDQSNLSSNPNEQVSAALFQQSTSREKVKEIGIGEHKISKDMEKIVMSPSPSLSSTARSVWSPDQLNRHIHQEEELSQRLENQPPLIPAIASTEEPITVDKKEQMKRLIRQKAKDQAKKKAIQHAAQVMESQKESHSPVIQQLQEEVKKKSWISIGVGILAVLLVGLVIAIVWMVQVKKKEEPQRSVEQKVVTRYMDSSGNIYTEEEAKSAMEAAELWKDVAKLDRKRATYPEIVDGLAKIELIRTKAPKFYEKNKTTIDSKKEVLEKWKASYDRLGGDKGQ